MDEDIKAFAFFWHKKAEAFAGVEPFQMQANDFAFGAG